MPRPRHSLRSQPGARSRISPPAWLRPASSEPSGISCRQKRGTAEGGNSTRPDAFRSRPRWFAPPSPPDRAFLASNSAARGPSGSRRTEPLWRETRMFSLQDKALLNARNMADIGHIKEFSSLNLSKHRSVINAFVHIIAAITAYQINPIKPKRNLQPRYQLETTA